ncbi:MAG: hypothetical protein LC804_12960 [Acidobacteria bacterium]|nr:hypothetical protein [Acidobacteriota bacterium]
MNTSGFADRLGERLLVLDPASGETLEVLRLRPELTGVPSFEFALRERTARLANFRHAYYARVRRVDRMPHPSTGLAIVSEHAQGTRLSDILRVVEQRRLTLDINAALCLVRQLVPALTLLHENARDVAHGAIAPERLVITPHARLVVVEHVLGSALEQLQLTRERLWHEFRIPMPATAGTARFDQRADVTQVGVVALSLILGRVLREEEYPGRLRDLVNQATGHSVSGERQPLSPGLRQWVSRAVQLDLRRPFQTAREAQTALDEVLAEDSGYVAAPVALETFLSDYLRSAMPETAPVADPPVSSSPAPVVKAAPAALPSPVAKPAIPVPPVVAPAPPAVKPAPMVKPTPAVPPAAVVNPADLLTAFADSPGKTIQPRGDASIAVKPVPVLPRGHAAGAAAAPSEPLPFGDTATEPITIRAEPMTVRSELSELSRPG